MAWSTSSTCWSIRSSSEAARKSSPTMFGSTSGCSVRNRSRPAACCSITPSATKRPTRNRWLKSGRHLRPVLQRLSQMMRLDVSHIGQIGDCPGQFEDAVVAAGGELELLHGGSHQGIASTVELAEMLDLF